MAVVRGSGYVVESLEAAMWCFIHTDSFKDTILMAANLGDDADTTAAVCGQVAGAYYGVSGIPAGWLERLALRSEIATLADRLSGEHSNLTSELNPFADQPDDDHGDAEAADDSRNLSNRLHQCHRIV